jgi:hypothetical protein
MRNSGALGSREKKYSGELGILTFLFACPKRKVTKEKGSTNTAPLPAAGRLAAARARVGRPDNYRDSCTSTR